MARTGQITAKVEIEQVQKALAGTSKSLTSIQKQTLAVIAKGTVKVIKRSIQTSGLRMHTGELLKAYRYKTKRDLSEANVFPKALKSKDKIFSKAMALSYGAENGNWKLKPHGFVQKGNEYVEKGNYQGELDKLVENQLKKYWG